jgi:GT2 family glycosyltransferase
MLKKLKKENESEQEPLVSIILIIKNNFHLLSRTLDNVLLQQGPSFEVIIVENGFTRHEWHIVKQYPFISKVESCFDQKIPYMINRSISLARGKYIQILFPGDIFILQDALSQFASLQEEEEPDLICSYFLLRDGISPPEVIERSFSRKFLHVGKSPCRLSSTWIKKEVFQKIGFFDLRYPQRANFDFFCRIYRDKSLKVVYLSKVLMDYEFSKKNPKDIGEYAIESMVIIFRHFGVLQTLYWFFFHDHFRMIKWWLRSLKQMYLRY